MTILVSAVVSLTLTPMMCAKLLGHQVRNEARLVLPESEAAFNWVIAMIRLHAAVGTAAPAVNVMVTLATLVADDLPLYRRPKGFFPVQDTGVILGVSRGSGNDFLPAMAKRQQAARKSDFAGSCRGKLVFIYRCRWD